MLSPVCVLSVSLMGGACTREEAVQPSVGAHTRPPLLCLSLQLPTSDQPVPGSCRCEAPEAPAGPSDPFLCMGLSMDLWEGAQQ